MLRILTLSFFLFVFVIPVNAFEPPALKGGVNDYAGMLNASVSQKLSQALESIYNQGGPQVAVLTVKNMDSMVIEDASMVVAKKWQLGRADKDDGVLLMVAKKERKMRIEVGQALEGALTDVESHRIIDNIMVPLFRQGQYTDGVLLAVDAILKKMEPPIRLEKYLQQSIPERTPQKKSPLKWVIDIVVMLVMLFVFIRNPFLFLLFLGGGRGRGFGGGGFGGGGFSGGGGGFSGGGASGSW